MECLAVSGGNDHYSLFGKEYKMRIFRIAMALIFLFTFATLSLAGVVVESGDGSTAYFSSGKVKNVPSGDDPVTIFNAKDSTLTLINRKEKTYTTTTVEEFARTVKGMKDEAMAQLSPEQQKMMEQFMAGPKNRKAPKVAIKKLGSGGEIAGYPTSKYLVTEDGRNYEELYLAGKDFPVSQEMDLDSLWNFSEKFSQSTAEGLGFGAGKSVEADPAYQQIMRSGFPLKTVSFANGGPEITDQVVSVTKRSLADSQFKAPAGYKKLTPRAFFEQENQASMDEENSGGHNPSSYPMPEE